MVVEELTWPYFGLKFGVCIDGQNACPPEDVGGVPGYEQFLEAHRRPRATRSTTTIVAWVGRTLRPRRVRPGRVPTPLLQKVR